MGRDDLVGLYSAHYGNFESDVFARIRAEAFGEDIGQTGWLTAEEQDIFIDLLGLKPGHRMLDVACGAARPTMRIAEKTGCTVVGVDIDDRAIAGAIAAAAARGLSSRAEFRTAAGETALAEPDASFDAVMCIDAINHFRDKHQQGDMAVPLPIGPIVQGQAFWFRRKSPKA